MTTTISALDLARSRVSAAEEAARDAEVARLAGDPNAARMLAAAGIVSARARVARLETSAARLERAAAEARPVLELLLEELDAAIEAAEKRARARCLGHGRSLLGEWIKSLDAGRAAATAAGVPEDAELEVTVEAAGGAVPNAYDYAAEATRARVRGTGIDDVEVFAWRDRAPKGPHGRAKTDWTRVRRVDGGTFPAAVPGWRRARQNMEIES